MVTAVKVKIRSAPLKINVGKQGPTGPAGGSEVQTNTQNVTTNGQTQFSIPATAVELLTVNINQIDYVTFCAINPPGSGTVVYTPPSGGYTTESGDQVHIEYLE